MLKNRVLTASLLAPFIIAAILFLLPDGFAGLLRRIAARLRGRA